VAELPLTSTTGIPEVRPIPRHIAIIMDGNGRWAKLRGLPRAEGHRQGVEAVHRVVRHCAELGVEHLTLFAFSSENWRRPAEEVGFLMGLFRMMLQREVTRMHRNGVRLTVIGDRGRFDAELQSLIAKAEARTAGNTKICLNIAANYGGRWDIVQAMNRLTRAHPERAGCYTELELQAELALGWAPEPDLFIRTGGEQRLSNFLLWQLAYTELYFTDTLWPDFREEALDEAVRSYQCRERRFGRTSEQLAVSS
jgi:undecaprenyl diphosphate synthase